jgi:lysine-specific permease
MLRDFVDLLHAISHYRFRQAFLHQGKNLNKLPYQAKWYPIGPILAFVICTIIILGQNYSVIIGSHVDWYEVLATYIGLLLFLVFWFGYKIIKKTKVIPLQQVNLEHDDH